MVDVRDDAEVPDLRGVRERGVGEGADVGLLTRTGSGPGGTRSPLQNIQVAAGPVPRPHLRGPARR
ncbi:hypothetical protein RAJCM14343_5898 [Rhodococcus aetherivorans]|uniref:Uncharacterized protein n=1 Tax=Rhodococcus aetherivorans TaxID=191292 RepID=A0ABQ0YVY1_9NOCA|nr:hypothetical protein RAJCM14343_5898 [Rhodococcus aetherivorans]CCW10691.1 hypothetical protein EBESD8_12220 [Rhodococcus aetherivorans]